METHRSEEEGEACNEQHYSVPPGSTSVQLEEQISVEQFTVLMEMFSCKGLHRHSQYTRRMSTAEFKRTLTRLLGRKEGDEKIALLCAKIDTEGEGFIDQDEFCSYILQQLRERDSLQHMRSLPFQDPPKFKHNMYSKETLCRLMSISNPLRYITVSKDGLIGTWTPTLQLQRGTAMTGDHAPSQRGRKTILCITDSATMNNCNKLVVALTSRELVFYDLSTSIYKCQCKIHDLPCVPLCMDYYYSAESPSSPSHLLYGDEAGTVTVLTFHRPLVGLFHGNSSREEDTITLIAFTHLSEHAGLVSVQCMPQLHLDWVRQVRYVWHNHSVLSCASSPSQSLVLRDIDHKRRNYTFRIRKGVISFDYSHELDVLVTGSVDHAVRVWNPYVPSRPMAVLQGHTTAVMDVLISRDLGLIFSFSQDSVLCAWDIFEHVLVQTINVKFPFSQRLPEYGTSILTLLPSHSLTILCNEYIAEFKTGASLGSTNDWVVTSHAHPITAALYNPHFHQVVSGCEGGVVNVWDMDSGGLVLRFIQCHGNHEITSMAFDSAGRRLITGSRMGDIKVWNYMSGVCVKCMQTSDETEVTGLLHLLDKGRFLTVGWNKRITSFKDEPDILEERADGCWQGEDHHKDDILCMSYCPPHYLATGSFDGEIVVWNVDTEKVVSRFQSTTKLNPSLMRKNHRKFSVSVSRTPPQSISTSSRPASRKHSSSRPASRKLSSYRIRSNSLHLHHVPIDRVLFLRRRMRTRTKGSATLISSEDGHAHFRDIFRPKESLGSIPLTDFDDENVLALHCSPCDQHLLAGDTAGYITVYDIQNYCNAPHQDEIIPDPLARWRAHAREVLSIEYVPHEQSLVLSASGDCTVRLWTLQGHYIGTFGQEQPWDLRNPSTFQHPRLDHPFASYSDSQTSYEGCESEYETRRSFASLLPTIQCSTPWGEATRPSSTLPEMSSPGSRRSSGRGSAMAGDIPSIAVVVEEREGVEEGEGAGVKLEPPSQSTLTIPETTPRPSPNHHISTTTLTPIPNHHISTTTLTPTPNHHISTTTLTPTLTDKSLLGEPYRKGVHRRMADRQERRVQFAEVNMRATERFGSLCSPFQALQLLNVDDVSVPKELSSALQHSNS